MYRYDAILNSLKANPSIMIDTNTVPSCPLTSPLCKKPAGDCEKGNSGNCEQSLKIWIEPKKLHILYPRFVHPADSTNGYFLEYDKKIAYLVEKGILSKTDLQTF